MEFTSLRIWLKKFYQDGRFVSLEEDIKKEVILTPQAAQTMQKIFIDVIEKGTGKKLSLKV